MPVEQKGHWVWHTCVAGHEKWNDPLQAIRHFPWFALRQRAVRTNGTILVGRSVNSPPILGPIGLILVVGLNRMFTGTIRILKRPWPSVPLKLDALFAARFIWNPPLPCRRAREPLPGPAAACKGRELSRSAGWMERRGWKPRRLFEVSSREKVGGLVCFWSSFTNKNSGFFLENDTRVERQGCGRVQEEA